MVDYKTILGLVAIGIGTISYSFYFYGIFKGKTKPDGFSWLIWSMLAAITFFAQNSAGAGAGAWPTLFTAVVCFTIAAITFWRDSRSIKKIKTIDSSSFAGALISIGLWRYTSAPLIAVILVIFVGAWGFVPTYRKAFLNPQSETLTTYALNATKFCLAFFALQTFTPVTWLYPAAMVGMNACLALMIFWRRNLLNKINLQSHA